MSGVCPRVPGRQRVVASPLSPLDGGRGFDLPTFGPLVAAKVAKLRYVRARVPRIVRRSAGESFVYRDPEGRAARRLRFARALRSPSRSARRGPTYGFAPFPPTATSRWWAAMPADANSICYHPRWREVRDEAKFAHMLTFGSALPRIRAAGRAATSRRRGLPREQVLAAVVRLMERTLGPRRQSPNMPSSNKSFGLTTLRDAITSEIDGGQHRARFPRQARRAPA